MKTKYLLISLVIFFCLYPAVAAFGYREVYTSAGKVIVDLDREKALEKFGVPDSAGSNIWRYDSPEQFFVYFSGSSLLNIYLYPQFSEAQLGSPLELKAYGYFSDLKIKDITSEVQILVDEKWKFDFTKSGAIIPLRKGKYQVLAKYGNIFSNPCQVVVKESPQNKEEEQEKCLSINIIPYTPKVTPNSKWVFRALGTFFSPKESTYNIKDITGEVEWFVKKDQLTVGLKDNVVQFSPLPAKQSMFCKYQGLESLPQEISVSNTPIPSRMILKHITLLPEFVFVSAGSSFNLRAFATYNNNHIKEITHLVKWKFSNRDTVRSLGSGNFSAAFEGICDVVADTENIQSVPAKVVVVSKRQSPSDMVVMREGTGKTKERKADSDYSSPDDLVKKIKEDTENLSKDFFKEEKKLKSIRIDPASFKISLGESAQAVARGLYSDKTEEDLTISGEWKASDDKIFGVSAGKISTHIPGEARLYVKFKGTISPPALVTVEGPKLVSIVVSPVNSRISMKGNVMLKAEGCFSDSSRKDITPIVTWEVLGRGIVRIDNAIAYPLKVGQAQVVAQYSGIKSLPVNIRVMLTLGWFLEILLKAITFLIMCTALIMVVFYTVIRYKINKMKAFLRRDPRGFIISLYENARDILGIFGFRHDGILPPLSYAGLVDNKYSIKLYYYGVLGLKKQASPEDIKNKYRELAMRYHPDKAKAGKQEKSAQRFKDINKAYGILSNPHSNTTFINFTSRFEEAKYSVHPFESQDALSILSEYNYFIKIMLSHYDKVDLFFKYCLTLLKTKPLYI